MHPIVTLTRGIEILEPFLKRQYFEFDNYENGKGSGKQFTIVTYKNDRKKFLICYLPPVGQVVYQYDDSKVFHNFYLEQLGLAGKKKFHDFQTSNQLLAFTHILHDFDFLVEDFFHGQCIRLKEFSKLHDSILNEYNKNAQEEFSSQFDKIRIETAREEFGNRDFKKSIEIYRRVENKNLFNDLDKKIIEYCERHI